MARFYTMHGGPQPSGYLGGDVSMAERHRLRDKYLKPIADFARDAGLRNQCRCGGTLYVRWRGRHYCMHCARWVRVLIADQRQERKD